MLSKANTRHVGAEAADDDVRSGDVFRNAKGLWLENLAGSRRGHGKYVCACAMDSTIGLGKVYLRWVDIAAISMHTV